MINDDRRKGQEGTCLSVQTQAVQSATETDYEIRDWTLEIKEKAGSAGG